MLANEAPVAAFRAEAWITAGEALRKAERFTFALEHLERGLDDRAAQSARPARERDLPAATRAGGAPGILWIGRGRTIERAGAYSRRSRDVGAARARRQGCLDRRLARPGRHRADADEAADEDALLRAAIESYAKAYRRIPGTTTPASTRSR